MLIFTLDISCLTTSNLPWFMNLTLHVPMQYCSLSIELYSHQHCDSCLTPCNPMDCSLPGSSVHGIFQARILEWFAISFSRGSSFSRDQTQVSSTAGRFFTDWTTREAHPQLGIVGFDPASSFFLEPISPLFTSNILDTYWLGGRIFQCHIFLPFHTFHGILKARMKWFAIPIWSGPHFVKTLHHDPSILGGTAQHSS